MSRQIAIEVGRSDVAITVKSPPVLVAPAAAVAISFQTITPQCDARDHKIGKFLGDYPCCGSGNNVAGVVRAAWNLTRLVRIGTELSNQIRGLMKTFGLIIPPCTGSKFERNVEALLSENAELGRIILPLLEAWHFVRIRAAELGRKLLADARRSEAWCPISSTSTRRWRRR